MENMFGRPQTAAEKQNQIEGKQAAATSDAEAARRKVEADATSAANQQLLVNARRKRSQAGLLALDSTNSSVLAGGANPTASTVLGGGGA